LVFRIVQLQKGGVTPRSGKAQPWEKPPPQADRPEGTALMKLGDLAPSRW